MKRDVSFLFPNSTSPTLGKFCGTSRPYPVYSGGQYLRVTLHSSNTGVNMDHFFKAQYNLINAKPSSQASEYSLNNGSNTYGMPACILSSYFAAAKLIRIIVK